MVTKVDMAYTAKEKKERNEPSKSTAIGSSPEYPYGMTLRLEDDQLKKLGMDSLPKVGASIALEATCKVVSVSKNESVQGHSSRCVELQIQKLGLDTEPDGMEGAIKRGAREAD